MKKDKNCEGHNCGCSCEAKSGKCEDCSCSDSDCGCNDLQRKKPNKTATSKKKF